ncbi:MAG: hypothetical protein ACRD8W_07015 [Nitrososphaeraceae archaeon]
MVRRKANRIKSTITSQNKTKRIRKRTKISPVQGKVTTRPNKKNQRSVKQPGMDTSRSRKSVRNSNIKLNKSDRIHKTVGAPKKTTRTRTNPKREKSIYVKRSSGRQEKFDSDRMTQTVSRSGVPFLMARDITKKVVRKIGRRQKNKEMSKSSKSTKNSNSQRKKVANEVIIPGNEIRSMISEELRNRNRSDIAGSYEGQSPSNPRLERDESIDPTVPSLHNVTTPKTNIIHDKSKYGGV